MTARLEAYVILVLLLLMAAEWFGAKWYYYEAGHKDGVSETTAKYAEETGKAKQAHDDAQAILDQGAADRAALEGKIGALSGKLAAVVAAGKTPQKPVKVEKVYPAGCITTQAVLEAANNARR